MDHTRIRGQQFQQGTFSDFQKGNDIVRSEWAKVKIAAEFYGVSPRTLRKWLDHGLPHSRLPSGTILIELDAGSKWLRSFEVGQKLQGIVEEIIDELL
jgi:hypothetical protein